MCDFQCRLCLLHFPRRQRGNRLSGGTSKQLIPCRQFHLVNTLHAEKVLNSSSINTFLLARIDFAAPCLITRCVVPTSEFSRHLCPLVLLQASNLIHCCRLSLMNDSYFCRTLDCPQLSVLHHNRTLLVPCTSLTKWSFFNLS